VRDWQPEKNLSAQQLANHRLTAITYHENNFDLIFGNMTDDFNHSPFKTRFDIPDRG
jgi:hypothetical protein